LIRDRQIGKEYIACVVWTPDFNALAKNYNYSFTTTWWLELSEPLFKWFSSNTNRAHVFVNEEKWLESVTDVEILSSYEHEIIWPISLLKCTLHTGRMHQIRVHLAHIGHPILGDIQYWLPVINRLAHKNCWITRQLLHSYIYTFSSLEDKEIAVTAPPPQEFEKLFWDYDYTKIK
jgi:23S rRNA-/tRNA-specific pseudouridylate synthase